jgi:hypothetical protein
MACSQIQVLLQQYVVVIVWSCAVPSSLGPRWRAAWLLQPSMKLLLLSRYLEDAFREGVLSPLLMCLVVNDLIARLSGAGVFIQGYADGMSSCSG